MVECKVVNVIPTYVRIITLDLCLLSYSPRLTTASAEEGASLAPFDCFSALLFAILIAV